MIDNILKGCIVIKQSVADMVDKLRMGNLSTDYAFKSMNGIDDILSEVQKDITYLGNEIQKVADEMEKFAKHKQFEESSAIASVIETVPKWLVKEGYELTDEDEHIVRKYRKTVLRVLLNHSKLYQRLIDNNRFYELDKDTSNSITDKLNEWKKEVEKADKLIFQVNTVK